MLTCVGVRASCGVQVILGALSVEVAVSCSPLQSDDLSLRVDGHLSHTAEVDEDMTIPLAVPRVEAASHGEGQGVLTDELDGGNDVSGGGDDDDGGWLAGEVVVPRDGDVGVLRVGREHELSGGREGGAERGKELRSHGGGGHDEKGRRVRKAIDG